MSSSEVEARKLPLPRLWGLGNDYSFLERRLRDRGLDRISSYRPTRSLSIVIPVHNRAHLLEFGLAALTRQDLAKDQWEVIVVDDGSNDRPDKVCERSTLHDLRCLSLEPSGAHTESRARNAGIAAARNDVILQLDPEILLSPRDALRWLLRWFEVSDNVVVTARREFIGSDGVRAADVMAGDWSGTPTGESDGHEPWLSDPSLLKHAAMPYLDVYGCCMAYTRERALAAGGYDETRCQWGGVDLEFAYRLYELGSYCINESNVRIQHLHHERTTGDGSHRDFLARTIPPYRVHRYPGTYRTAGQVPRVSVYIPARNVAPYIADALNSARKQTFDDLEICVCDDGSTDGTAEVVESVIRDDARVRLVRQEPRGCGAASNAAIRMARGEFVVGLDGDDVIEPRAVERLVEEFDRRPYLGFVYGNLIRTDERLRPQAVGEGFRRYKRHLALTCMYVSAPRMFRRRLHHLVGGHVEHRRSAVDYDFVLRCSERAAFAYVNEVLYHYRTRPESLSTQWTSQSADALAGIEDALARMQLAQHFTAIQTIDRRSRWYSYERR